MGDICDQGLERVFTPKLVLILGLRLKSATYRNHFPYNEGYRFHEQCHHPTNPPTSSTRSSFIIPIDGCNVG